MCLAFIVAITSPTNCSYTFVVNPSSSLKALMCFMTYASKEITDALIAQA